MRPMTRGSPPKRACQNPYPRITTGCAPGLRSSSPGMKVLPNAGFTPYVWKKLALTRSPMVRSDVPSEARDMGWKYHAATFSKTSPVRSRRSWKWGMELEP